MIIVTQQTANYNKSCYAVSSLHSTVSVQLTSKATLTVIHGPFVSYVTANNVLCRQFWQRRDIPQGHLVESLTKKDTNQRGEARGEISFIVSLR